jgi:hypothetical protein
MHTAIDNSSGKHEENDEAYRDEGFIIEDRGSYIVYRRPVSKDTLEASRLFSHKRRAGYMSKDIPGKKAK